MPSVDEKLLAQEKDSADRAGDIREAKKNSQRGQYVNNNQDKGDLHSQLRQKKQEKKRKKNLKNKKGASGLINPLAFSLARLLRQSWINLIQSFGLTLIWINIHVLGNIVFGPKVFCNLGEEWFMRPGATNSPEQKKIIEEGGKKIGILEKMGCGCLNLLFLLVVVIFLALIAIVLEIFGDPIGFISEVAKAVLGWVWDGVVGVFTRSEN